MKRLQACQKQVVLTLPSSRVPLSQASPAHPLTQTPGPTGQSQGLPGRGQGPQAHFLNLRYPQCQPADGACGAWSTGKGQGTDGWQTWVQIRCTTCQVT